MRKGQLNRVPYIDSDIFPAKKYEMCIQKGKSLLQNDKGSIDLI